MTVVLFNKKVKYKGVLHPSNTEFNVDDKDLEELVRIGAIIVKKTSDKEESNEVDSKEVVEVKEDTVAEKEESEAVAVKEEESTPEVESTDDSIKEEVDKDEEVLVKDIVVDEVKKETKRGRKSSK